MRARAFPTVSALRVPSGQRAQAESDMEGKNGFTVKVMLLL